MATTTNLPALLFEEIHNKVLTLRLNNPPAHALSTQMIETLRLALSRAADDPDVNVIVLAASGRIFCAGHDLKEMRAHRGDADRGRAWFEALFGRCNAMMLALAENPKPTIAMVDGIATAAGCQLVASCDLAFASVRAGFCTPGVNMGGFCSTPAVALSRNLSRKHAMEMLLTGDMIDPGTALNFGLINRVLPVTELADTVTAFAARLASRAPAPIAEGKRAFRRQLEMPLPEAYALAAEAMVGQFFGVDDGAPVDAGIDAVLGTNAGTSRDDPPRR